MGKSLNDNGDGDYSTTRSSSKSKFEVLQRGMQGCVSDKYAKVV